MSKNKYGRKTPFRQAKEEVLVVCGGQTEKIYFDAFKLIFRPSLGNINIVTAVKAKNPMQIVHFAIKMREQKETYNAVWCVFDKDDFTDFDESIKFAKRNGIETAFSNQAFEVWFINHYRLLNTSLHRNKYKEELGKYLSFSYDKNQEIIIKVCDILLTADKLKEAIKNARFSYEHHKTYTKPALPSAFESCTTVFILIKSLLNWVD